jgi:hypothetical protein
LFELTNKIRHDLGMKSATVALSGLIAIVSSVCFAQAPPSLPTETSISPSTHLLEILKQGLDNDQLLQKAFFSDESLKTFFAATSIHWFIKDGDPPHVGKIAAIKTALIPAADIRASSLFVPGAPKARSISIAIKGVPLTQEEVIAVFGTPVVWNRKGDPHGDRIPLPLHFGDVEGPVRRPWDGTATKGASFSIAHDGSVNGILILATGYEGDAKLDRDSSP